MGRNLIDPEELAQARKLWRDRLETAKPVAPFTKQQPSGESSDSHECSTAKPEKTEFRLLKIETGLLTLLVEYPKGTDPREIEADIRALARLRDLSEDEVELDYDDCS